MTTTVQEASSNQAEFCPESSFTWQNSQVGSIGANVSQNGKKRSPRVFLALHFGAGNHSRQKENMYRDLSEAAFKKSLHILKHGGSADEAVVNAMVVLENSKKVNAGAGSNLTMNETVELDAGFMSGNGRFGGVGAVSGLPNPSVAAKQLAELHYENDLITPNLLVGAAAKTWAASVGLKTCDDLQLICQRAKKMYAKFVVNRKEAIRYTENDTIGCVALDVNGHVAAAGSTGGGLFKMSGRVGPVAQFGCGIFASDGSASNPLATAIAATGTGEYLTELRLAASCNNYIRQQKFQDPISAVTDYWSSIVAEKRFSAFPKTPVAGFIGITDWSKTKGEFFVSHNSDNMVYAYTGSMFDYKIKVKYSDKTEGRNYKLDVFNF